MTLTTWRSPSNLLAARDLATISTSTSVNANLSYATPSLAPFGPRSVRRPASATSLVGRPATISWITSANVKLIGAPKNRAMPSLVVSGQTRARRLVIALTWTLQHLLPLKVTGPVTISTSTSVNANPTDALLSCAMPSLAPSGPRSVRKPASATLLADRPAMISWITSANAKLIGAPKNRAMPSLVVSGLTRARRLAIALTWTLQHLLPLKVMGPVTISTSTSVNANLTDALLSCAMPSLAPSGPRSARRP